MFGEVASFVQAYTNNLHYFANLLSPCESVNPMMLRTGYETNCGATIAAQASTFFALSQTKNLFVWVFWEKNG